MTHLYRVTNRLPHNTETLDVDGFFMASGSEDAVEQMWEHMTFLNWSLDNVSTVEVAQYTNLSAETEVVHRCLYSAIDYCTPQADRTLSALIRSGAYLNYPSSVVSDLLTGELPQSLDAFLDTIPPSQWDKRWLEQAVEWQLLACVKVLVSHGFQDKSGKALMYACLLTNSDIFNVLWGVSSAQQALEWGTKEGVSLPWVEERLGAEQRARIAQEVAAPAPTRQLPRKKL